MSDKAHEPEAARLFYFASAAVIAIGYFFRDEIGGYDRDFWYLVKVAVLAAAVSAVGSGVAWIEKRVIQRKRDIQAARVLKEAKSAPSATKDAFGLYLRPFFTTGKLGVEEVLRRPMMPIFPSYHEALAAEKAPDLEASLTKALEPTASLIAVGRPGEQIGAGRVASDEETWQEDVALLAQRARFIVFVPSERAGTSWEIDLARREGLLHKCIFVMPPELHYDAIDLRAAWQRATKEIRKLGLRLPNYEPEGLLFRLGADGWVADKRPLTLGDHARIRKTFEALCVAPDERGDDS